MLGRTHLATGVTAGSWGAATVAAIGVPNEQALLFAGLVAYAALLPDLDHPRSTATYSLGPVTIVVSWVLRLFVEHRGWTHRPVGAVTFGALAAIGTAALPEPMGPWFVLWGVAVSLGCLVHIWGDARTVSGVPRSRGRRLRIGRPFVTGSDHERWRLAVIYGPTAVVSAVLAAMLVG